MNDVRKIVFLKAANREQLEIFRYSSSHMVQVACQEERQWKIYIYTVLATFGVLLILLAIQWIFSSKLNCLHNTKLDKRKKYN